MKTCTSIKVIVFSISADIEKIKDVIRDFTVDDNVMMLSPHKVFDNEKEFLTRYTTATLLFKSFADFISERNDFV